MNQHSGGYSSLQRVKNTAKNLSMGGAYMPVKSGQVVTNIRNIKIRTFFKPCRKKVIVSHKVTDLVFNNKVYPLTSVGFY